jgi:hypothetical protein
MSFEIRVPFVTVRDSAPPCPAFPTRWSRVLQRQFPLKAFNHPEDFSIESILGLI